MSTLGNAIDDRLNQTDEQIEALDQETQSLIQIADNLRQYVNVLQLDPSPTADNTASLLTALKSRNTTGNRPRISIPPGTWRFATPNILSLLTTSEQNNLARGFEIEGAVNESEVQGTDTSGMQPATVFDIDLPGNDDFWMRRLRDLNDVNSPLFGVISFKNIVFRVPTGKRGSIFHFGLTTANEADGAFRGLYIDQCRFAFQDHILLGDTQWINDDGDGVGYVVNRDASQTAIKLGNAYDCKITNTSFRGWKWPIVVSTSDAITLRDNHYILCGHGPLFTSVAGVPGVIGPNEFVEHVQFAGLTIGHGRAIGYLSETGYPNIPQPGVYDCAESNLTWSITANATTIVLANMPTGYDARDFLEPWTIIRVIPTDITQPAREFVIYDVTETGASLLFAGGMSGAYEPCRVPVTINGSGNGLQRLWGVNAIYFGDRVASLTPCHNRNLDIGQVPLFACVPYKQPMPLSGEIFSASLDTGGACIIRHHHGGASILGGGVAQDSPIHRIDHPCVTSSAEYPTFTSSVRNCRRDVRGFEFWCDPSCGISSGNNNSADLLFRRASTTDDPTQQPPWAFYLDDLITVKNLRVAFPTYAGLDVTIRVYSPSARSGVNGFRIYDGVAQQRADVSEGWQNVTFTLSGSASVLWLEQTLNDGTTKGGYQIAWIGANR